MHGLTNSLGHFLSLPYPWRLRRTLGVVALAMVAWGNALWAEEHQNPSISAAEARFLVENTTSRVLAAMSRDHEAIESEPWRAFDLVERIVMPSVDLERICRLLLGSYWRGATEKQQKRFMKEFGNQLIRTYVIGLSDYLAVSGRIGIEIRYLPVNLSNDKKKALVRSRVGISGARTSIDYRLHHMDDEWQVYDVLVDGVSVVSTYKSSFTAAARRGGIDYLIERIAEQNRRSSPA